MKHSNKIEAMVFFLSLTRTVHVKKCKFSQQHDTKDVSLRYKTDKQSIFYTGISLGCRTYSQSRYVCRVLILRKVRSGTQYSISAKPHSRQGLDADAVYLIPWGVLLIMIT